MSIDAYVLPYHQGRPLILLGFALLAFIDFAFAVAWAAFGSGFKLLFSKYARAANTVMALLVHCAVSMFL